MPLTGGCLCGQVRYTADSHRLTAICHCTHCRRQSGSAFAWNVMVKRSALKIEGETRTFADKGESGGIVERVFCPSCGSPLVSIPAAVPGMAVLKAGTLDAPEELTPTMEIWAGSALPWVAPVSSDARYAKNPTG